MSLLNLKFTAAGTGEESEQYMYLEDARQEPHFLMRQVEIAAQAMLPRPEAAKAYFFEAGGDSVELTLSSVEQALRQVDGCLPLLLVAAEDCPLPPTASRPACAAPAAAATPTEAARAEALASWAMAGTRFLAVKVQKRFSAVEPCEWGRVMLKHTEADPAAVYRLAQRLGRELLPTEAEPLFRYEDEDGDWCTFTEATASDAVSQVLAAGTADPVLVLMVEPRSTSLGRPLAGAPTAESATAAAAPAADSPAVAAAAGAALAAESPTVAAEETLEHFLLSDTEKEAETPARGLRQWNVAQHALGEAHSGPDVPPATSAISVQSVQVTHVFRRQRPSVAAPAPELRPEVQELEACRALVGYLKAEATQREEQLRVHEQTKQELMLEIEALKIQAEDERSSAQDRYLAKQQKHLQELEARGLQLERMRMRLEEGDVKLKEIELSVEQRLEDAQARSRSAVEAESRMRSELKEVSCALQEAVARESELHTSAEANALWIEASKEEAEHLRQALKKESSDSAARVADLEITMVALREELQATKMHDMELHQESIASKHICAELEGVVDGLTQKLATRDAELASAKEALSRCEADAKRSAEKRAVAIEQRQVKVLQDKQDLAHRSGLDAAIAGLRSELADRTAEFNALRAASARDPRFSAKVMKSELEMAAAEMEGADDVAAAGDVSGEQLTLLERLGACQAFRICRTKMSVEQDDCPLVYSVTVQNDGKAAWPATTMLVHDSGPALGMPLLELGPVQPGCASTVSFELTLPKALEIGRATSAWVVRDVATGKPFGPVLIVEVEYTKALLFD